MTRKTHVGRVLFVILLTLAALGAARYTGSGSTDELSNLVCSSRF